MYLNSIVRYSGNKKYNAFDSCNVWNSIGGHVPLEDEINSIDHEKSLIEWLKHTKVSDIEHMFRYMFRYMFWCIYSSVLVANLKTEGTILFG